jgi:hypothetical protein
MCCVLDQLIPVSQAHSFVDFCEHVNCFNSTEEEAGLIAVQGIPDLCFGTSRTYHRPQICYKCVQLLIMLEVPLQIHATTASVLRTHFQITSTTSKLSCIT